MFSQSLNAALSVSPQGEVALMFETGTFKEEPICALLRAFPRRLDILLASGDFVQMVESIEENLLPAFEKARRILLLEVNKGHVVEGHTIPLLQQEQEQEVKKTALA